MPTLVNTIDSKELYSARAVADAAGNDIAQTYATKAELPTQAQADWDQNVASAPDFIKNRPLSRLVPASTVYDQDMVLTVGNNGDAKWGSAYILAFVSMMGSSDTIAQEMLDFWQTKQVVLVDPTYGKNLPLTSITYDGQGYDLHNRIFNGGGVYDGKLYSISVFWDSNSGSWSWTSTETTVPDELTAGSGVEIVSNVVNAKVDGTTVTFDENGCLTATGGGSSVNADWDAVSGPEEILNKPTPKTLTAGSNITVTETASTITIGANVPAPTPQVNADWDATSGVQEILNKPTVDQSYDGTSTNAQSGVAVADAIGNLPTNLTSAQIQAFKEALGVDETILFNTNDYYGSATLNLSEPFTNFERLKVLAVRANNDQSTPYSFSGPWCEFETAGITINSGKAFGSLTPWIFENKFWKIAVYGATSTTQFTWSSGLQKDMTSTAAGSMDSSSHSVQIKTVIGIHRIASN